MDEIEEIIDCKVVLCGHKHPFHRIHCPDISKKVDKGVSARIALATVNKRLDAFKQSSSLMSLTPKEIDALLQ